MLDRWDGVDDAYFKVIADDEYRLYLIDAAAKGLTRKALSTIDATRPISVRNAAFTFRCRIFDVLLIYRVMNRYRRLVFRSWKRCGQLCATISRPRFKSRDATRHVSHNSDTSVGQWMFVSTTVVSARIVVVVRTSCFTARCPNNSLTRFHVAGRTAWKQRLRKLCSITAFLRVRRKS